MKKIYEKYYRIECNYGSRYFADIENASLYFRRKQSKGLNAELWEVILCSTLDGKVCFAKQKLLIATPSALRKCD